MSSLHDLFGRLWGDYSSLNPLAGEIHDLLEGRGEKILNDHVAFRTFNHPSVNIEKMSEPFRKLGYQAKGEYVFKEKKLFALHFEHPDETQPKVFMSELKTEEFSKTVQEEVNRAVKAVPAGAATKSDFSFSGRPWNVNYATYEKLLSESEYAAWMYVFGFRPNHFTVNVNALKTFKGLEDLNAFLKKSGFRLNTSGGEIKGTPAEYLEQSSTLANEVTVKFEDGSHKIPACYYEFAKRHPLPSGKLYQGFIAASADKIFESTDSQRGQREKK